MMTKIISSKLTILLTSLFLTVGNYSTAQELNTQRENHSDKVVNRIAFGSCNNPRQKSNGMLDVIAGLKPDVFIFLGDNIYGDTEDMNLLKIKYEELGNQAGFKKLKEAAQILAIWDDHDYGINDGGKSYSKKNESQNAFLDFFEEPANSARRKSPGIYSSHTFGQKGKICQVILLDTRYFRDEIPRAQYPPNTKPKNIIGWYQPTADSSKTLLGETQWKWLEQQLQQPADFRIIASSIQILAHEKGMENWGNVPHEQQRLFQMLKKYKADKVIGISGDVHFAEVSKKDIGGYPFYDFTSSGMTHTSKDWSMAKNSFRMGEAFAGLNAGLIEIDWSTMQINLQVVDQDSKVVRSLKIPLSELKFQ